MSVDPEWTKKFFNQEDYRGAYHLVDTDMIGIYTPADQQHPAYSAPPPYYTHTFAASLMSADLEFYNIYYYQCQNYMLLASDSRRLEYAMTAEELFFPAIQDLFEEGKGWVITPNQQILTMHILEAQPRIHNEEQKIFDWNVKFDILPEAKVFRKDTGQLAHHRIRHARTPPRRSNPRHPALPFPRSRMGHPLHPRKGGLTMGPQHKEQETNTQQGSSQEAPPASSGQLLAHQQEPRKPRFSRRALAVAGVGTLGALIVGRQTGILATNEEKQEMRLLKRDRALIALEPEEKFDTNWNDWGSASGWLVYTAYERNGRYVPATEERAAQNVPYPVLQPKMNEYNRGGFYIFQAYFYAALNYFYYTGDTKPLSEVINPEEIISPELLRLYRENRGWLIANQDVYRVQVTIPGIGRRQKNGRNISKYQAIRLIRDEAVFYVPQTGEKLPIDKFLKTGEEEYAFLCAEHLRGRWVLVEDDKDATPLYPPGFSLEGLEV